MNSCDMNKYQFITCLLKGDRRDHTECNHRLSEYDLLELYSPLWPYRSGIVFYISPWVHTVQTFSGVLPVSHARTGK